MLNATRVNAHYHEQYLLSGARVAFSPWRAIPASLLVRDAQIVAVLPGKETLSAYAKPLHRIDLKDHLILPGLINVHDHLHLGMFPRLGHGPYPSWREWATDIYHPAEPPLVDLLTISKETRIWWGAIHNALSGVTTVCHHDALHPLLTSNRLPVNVHMQNGWAHSLDDPSWYARYDETPANQRFVVHFAEGTNTQSRQETKKLTCKVKLNERLVLVHAVGVSKFDWPKLREAGVWIVWCPTSNLHILGETLARDLILNYRSIALGSDSPISSAGDLLDELKTAHTLLDIPSDFLYRMVTNRAARLLHLPSHHGSIAEGGVADLFITRDTGQPPCESLSTLRRNDFAAVMRGGKIVVASDEFISKLDRATGSQLFPIRRYGQRWHVAAPPENLNLRTA